MGVIALIGSGEMAPTMVRLHRELLARVGPAPSAVFLDTPFGFQENADELTNKIVEFFDVSLHTPIQAPRFRGTPGESRFDGEAMLEAVRHADYVFAGPGSPSYALGHWRAVGLRNALGATISGGGAVVFASAAAVTSGSHAVPVYEIYKVGIRPYWLEGLDLLGLIGLRAAVVPHFDNAEGGTHDTRYCYLGQRRFDALLAELDVPVLGIDEHTAVVLDPIAGTGSVMGKGAVTIVTDTGSRRHEAGNAFDLSEIAGSASPPPVAPPVHSQGFDEALEEGDVNAAAAILMDHLLDGKEAAPMVVQLAAAAEAGLGDPDEVVAPFVDLLITLRSRARGAGDWATADFIRDELAKRGVEVNDGPDSTTWHR